jgi:protein-tyrosine kinase
MKWETRSELQKLSARCLLEISGDGPRGKAVFFSYTQAGEGNTTALCALGKQLGGSAGARILLADGNLRNPALHTFWKTPRDPGLVGACLSGLPLSSCVQPTRFPNVFVLPAGTPPENLDDFFTDPRFLQKVEEMRTEFQIVLFDSSPLLQSNDALALGKALDGAVLLARSEFLPASVIQKTHELLRGQNVKVLGAILNRKKNYVPGFVRNRLRTPEEA